MSLHKITTSPSQTSFKITETLAGEQLYYFPKECTSFTFDYGSEQVLVSCAGFGTFIWYLNSSEFTTMDEMASYILSIIK